MICTMERHQVPSAGSFISVEQLLFVQKLIMQYPRLRLCSRHWGYSHEQTKITVLVHLTQSWRTEGNWVKYILFRKKRKYTIYVWNRKKIANERMLQFEPDSRERLTEEVTLSKNMKKVGMGPLKQSKGRARRLGAGAERAVVHEGDGDADHVGSRGPLYNPWLLLYVEMGYHSQVLSTVQSAMIILLCWDQT